MTKFRHSEARKEGKKLKRIFIKERIKIQTASASHMIRGYSTYSDGINIAEDYGDEICLRIDWKNVDWNKIIKILKRHNYKYVLYRPQPNMEPTVITDIILTKK